MNGQERSAEARIVRGIIVIIVGLIIWYSPVPAGVKKEAWHLLAIFVATIFGLILTPLAMGAVVIIGVMMTTFTGVLKIGPALSGFANSTVWLIVAAFLVARGFISTGLGRRIAYMFIRAFGRKTIGLAYSIVASELVLSPATPSNTARAGGIIYPIVRARARSHLVLLAPGNDVRQGALARPVRAHDGMHLAGPYGKVHPPQDRFAVDCRVQALYGQHGVPLPLFVDGSGGHPAHPTLPSRLMPSNFWASTANSMGRLRITSWQKPFTIIETASSRERPRCWQ